MYALYKPEGANMKFSATIAALMLLAIFAGCTSFMARNSPDYVLKQGEWNTRSTEHFEFYFRPGSRSEKQIDTIVEGQERNYAEILQLLDASDPKLKIKTFIFPSLEDKTRITASSVYAHAVYPHNTVYCIDSDTIRNVIGKHEVTHLIVSAVWGSLAQGPLNWIVNDGIAVWTDGHWNGTELFEYMNLNLAKGGIVTPYDLAMHNTSPDQRIHRYPVAGAFVKYLIQQYGLEKLKQLYGEGHSQKDFLKIYGLEFSEASREFIEYMKSRN